MGIDWPLVAEAEPHLVNQWFGSLSDMVVAAAAEAAPVQAVAEAVPTAGLWLLRAMPTAEAVAAEAASEVGGAVRRLRRWGILVLVTGYSWTWCY